VNYSGWTTMRVTRSLEQLAHSFRLEMTDRWSDQHALVPVRRGDSCTIIHQGQRTETVIKGWIDENTLDYDANARSLGISGRSLTGDLVDCAAVHKGGSWVRVGLLRIAKDLCAPFNIDVRNSTDLGSPFSVFKLSDGETAFHALERACRMRGVTMVSDGDGALVFQRTGQINVTTVIERGVNILKCRKVDSHADRFSQYTVKTQAAAGGTGGDTFFGAALAQKRAAHDPRISRYRPTIITAETEQTGTELQKRADWERNVRAGRSCRLTYTIPGWEHSNGLWTPNTIVHVKDPDADVDDDLLVVTVNYERSEQGTTTTLELTQPAAYTVEPLQPKKQRKGAFDF